MNENQRKKLLMLLNEEQKDCAPIVIGLASVDDKRMIRRQIVLYEAPPIVIERLIYQDYVLGIENGYVYVDKFKEETGESYDGGDV